MLSLLLLTLPFLFLQAGIGIQVLISGFCLAVFINLFNLPTSLFSSRLEIFQTSMFSMQGANLKINLYAIAFFSRWLVSVLSIISSVRRHGLSPA